MFSQLLLVIALAVSLETPKPSPNSPLPPSCFICDQMYYDGLYYHEDIDNGSALKGDFHASWVLGSCADMLIAHHRNYSEEVVRVDDLQRLIEQGDEGNIVRFILENPEVRLNVQRNAIQVLAVTGEVSSHAKLDEHIVARIQPVIAEVSATRLQ